MGAPGGALSGRALRRPAAARRARARDRDQAAGAAARRAAVNLDANLREEMRFEIRRLHDEFRITTVYVTHDQAEAMVTSDRIAVMNQGRIEQVDEPHTLYNRPKTPLRRGLHRPHQFHRRHVQRQRGAFGGFAAAAGRARRRQRYRQPALFTPATGHRRNRHRSPTGANLAVEAEIAARSYLGEYWDYQVRPLTAAKPLRVSTGPNVVFEVGSRVWLEIIWWPWSPSSSVATASGGESSRPPITSAVTHGPRDKYFGNTIEERLAGVPGDLWQDAVGLRQIVSFGKEGFDLTGVALTDYVRRHGIAGAARHGADARDHAERKGKDRPARLASYRDRHRFSGTQVCRQRGVGAPSRGRRVGAGRRWLGDLEDRERRRATAIDRVEDRYAGHRPWEAWHRFHYPNGATLLTVTPGSSEYVRADVADPRTVEAQRD